MKKNLPPGKVDGGAMDSLQEKNSVQINMKINSYMLIRTIDYDVWYSIKELKLEETLETRILWLVALSFLVNFCCWG